jgi:hypothetical protein
MQTNIIYINNTYASALVPILSHTQNDNSSKLVRINLKSKNANVTLIISFFKESYMFTGNVAQNKI